jgi:hypothetical protein
MLCRWRQPSLETPPAPRRRGSMRSPAIVAACALAPLAALAGGEAAIAQTISKSIPPNRSSKLDHYTGWNDDCSFKEIRVDPMSKPAHGSYSVVITNGVIPADAKIGASGVCAGRPTKVLELYYRPDRGYHGLDSLTVNMSVGGSAPVTFTYAINVQ